MCATHSDSPTSSSLSPAFDYRRVLTEELERRCKKNPRYSLRAFARAIRVNPGTLSNVLSSRRNLGIGTAQRILEELALDPESSRRFMESVLTEKQLAFSSSLPVVSTGLVEKKQREMIDAERFTLISEWQHLGILVLSETRGFRSDSKWIAMQLGLTEIQVKLALERLERLELIKKVEDRWVRCKGPLLTSDRSKTSAGLRLFQKQMLEKSKESLERDPIEERGHFGMTMAINPKKIPEAKKIMERCLDELSALLESGPRTQVYHAGIQLFPIQKRSEKNES